MSNFAVQDRRSDVQKFVDELTAERTEMLALFCRVAGIDPFQKSSNGTGKHHQQTQLLLQNLCQVMVDYLSLGHFGLYERIARGQERRQNILDIASELYPRIAETTEVALNFNDKYDCEDHCEIGNDFSEELSRLGEALAIRIDLEDQLLGTL